jgi:hypothetical protein
MRQGIQLSEDGGAIFRHACGMGWKGSSRSGSARDRQRSDTRMAEANTRFPLDWNDQRRSFASA